LSTVRQTSSSKEQRAALLHLLQPPWLHAADASKLFDSMTAQQTGHYNSLLLRANLCRFASTSSLDVDQRSTITTTSSWHHRSIASCERTRFPPGTTVFHKRSKDNTTIQRQPEFATGRRAEYTTHRHCNITKTTLTSHWRTIEHDSRHSRTAQWAREGW